MAALLATAPSEGSEAARENPLVLSLPNPCGDFERFAVEESPIMEPGLAAKHPEINTYRGRGIDDPAATIRFDLTPLGFHASVRSPYGAWYIDPFYHLDDSLYVTYFGRDLGEDPHGGFGEQEADAFELLLDQVNDNSTTFPPTGDVLRTYRLALITDPGYATYFGGSPNVTAAKVTLINRVTQIYEDDLSIRLLLVNNNDLLNLDTYAQAIGPNGPCGAAGCFTQSQVTGCAVASRATGIVIGQIIGASNYDIGHLALGQPGGGVASLGVVGRGKQGWRLHRHPDAGRRLLRRGLRGARDGPPVQRQSHLQRQPTQLLRRQPQRVTSVEPGSGSSVMAYAGICLTDDLQAHSDPYFSQRSLQEISTYTTSSFAAINEVQTASLRHFGGGNEIQVVTFGPGYAPAAAIQPLSLAINAAPSATSRGGAEENGNTVTIATGNPHTLQVGDTVTIAGVGVAGYNGTWTVTAVPSSRSFQYTNPTAGLATSGGGTVTLAAPAPRRLATP